MRGARGGSATLALLFALFYALLLTATALAQTPTAQSSSSEGSQTSLGKVIVIPAGTTVNGDVTSWGADVQVLGTVNGRVTAVGGQVMVGDSGKVTNSVTAIVGNIVLGNSASVGHDALALGGNVNASNSIPNVGGSIAATGSGLTDRVRDYFGLRYAEPADRLNGLGLAFLNSYSWCALVFIFGVILLYFAPRALDNTSITLNYAPGTATLIGLLTALIIPIGLGAIAILLILSVIGIIALPVLIALAGLVAAYSLVVTGLWLGERVTGLLGKPNYSDTRRQIIPMALGLAIIGTASVLLNLAFPPLGGLFNLLALSFGLGAAVLSRFGQLRPVAAPLPIT
jgi:hypothetical protein